MIEYTILIIDDEPGMRLGAQRALKDFSFSIPDFEDEICFRTVLAEDGAAAMQILDHDAFEIILLDYKLPDMNGTEILNHIRIKNLDCLPIMITAYASLEIAVDTTKQGAFDFLSKPFTPDELRITVRKTAEHVYLNRKAQKLSEERKQIRFQFISVLGHELKSPLAAIENYLMIMRDKIKGDNITDYEYMIERSIVRINGMRDLIYDLLDLTRIESGTKKRVLEEINITETSEIIIEGLKMLAEKRNISITAHIPGNLLFTADRGEMEIILNNLLSNGIKYNKENGSIFLTITKENNCLTIRCKDSGIGMTEEDRTRLFNEFVRIKNDKTKNILGSGLGLSIVKKIASLYDGTVNVKSVPDEGSEFIVRLFEGE